MNNININVMDLTQSVFPQPWLAEIHGICLNKHLVISHLFFIVYEGFYNEVKSEATPEYSKEHSLTNRIKEKCWGRVALQGVREAKWMEEA